MNFSQLPQGEDEEPALTGAAAGCVLGCFILGGVTVVLGICTALKWIF